jgi:hypothetical protein
MGFGINTRVSFQITHIQVNGFCMVGHFLEKVRSKPASNENGPLTSSSSRPHFVVGYFVNESRRLKTIPLGNYHKRKRSI